jgi:hypothetical protein
MRPIFAFSGYAGGGRGDPDSDAALDWPMDCAIPLELDPQPADSRTDVPERASAMDVDRIPHMGGALRDEAPLWQKPANRRRKFVEEVPESEPEAEEAKAAEADPTEEQGSLDVMA